MLEKPVKIVAVTIRVFTIVFELKLFRYTVTCTQVWYMTYCHKYRYHFILEMQIDIECTGTVLLIIFLLYFSGYLSYPARTFPSAFSENGLFVRFPFLLPSIIALVLTGVWIPVLIFRLKDIKNIK